MKIARNGRLCFNSLNIGDWFFYESEDIPCVKVSATHSFAANGNHVFPVGAINVKRINPDIPKSCLFDFLALGSWFVLDNKAFLKVSESMAINYSDRITDKLKPETSVFLLDFTLEIP